MICVFDRLATCECSCDHLKLKQTFSKYFTVHVYCVFLMFNHVIQYDITSNILFCN